MTAPAFQEDPLPDDFPVVVEEGVKGVDAQVGHADVVGVRVNYGHRQTPAPVLDDDAFFTVRRRPGAALRLPALAGPVPHRYLSKMLFPAVFEHPRVYLDDPVRRVPQLLGRALLAEKGDLDVLAVVLDGLDGAGEIIVPGHEDGDIVIIFVSVS